MYPYADLYACFAVVKYTREAGVRTLERKIGALCRAVAVQIVEKDCYAVSAEEAKLDRSLKTNASGDVMAHPPVFPIIIDDMVVEDVLGVSSCLQVFC